MNLPPEQYRLSHFRSTWYETWENFLYWSKKTVVRREKTLFISRYLFPSLEIQKTNYYYYQSVFDLYSSTMDSMIRLKSSLYSDTITEIRRTYIKKNVNYDEFVSVVKSLHKIGDDSDIKEMTYRDNESDDVTFSSTRELDTAMIVSGFEQGLFIKVFLSKKESSKPILPSYESPLPISDNKALNSKEQKEVTIRITFQEFCRPYHRYNFADFALDTTMTDVIEKGLELLDLDYPLYKGNVWVKLDDLHIEDRTKTIRDVIPEPLWGKKHKVLLSGFITPPKETSIFKTKTSIDSSVEATNDHKGSYLYKISNGTLLKVPTYGYEHGIIDYESSIISVGGEKKSLTGVDSVQTVSDKDSLGYSDDLKKVPAVDEFTASKEMEKIVSSCVRETGDQSVSKNDESVDKESIIENPSVPNDKLVTPRYETFRSRIGGIETIDTTPVEFFGLSWLKPGSRVKTACHGNATIIGRGITPQSRNIWVHLDKDKNDTGTGHYASFFGCMISAKDAMSVFSPLGEMVPPIPEEGNIENAQNKESVDIPPVLETGTENDPQEILQEELDKHVKVQKYRLHMIDLFVEMGFDRETIISLYPIQNINPETPTDSVLEDVFRILLEDRSTQ